jgi:cell fate regulator YaaT (PSP1 superfamily)
MAKEQNFSLNSAKVSGACGRLMCCLRYEHETYEEALKVTPPVGSTVKTPDGVGTVTETRPLAAEIKVRLDDKEKDAIILYKCKDVKILKLPGKKDKSDEESEKTED